MSLSWSKDDSLFVCPRNYSIWQFDFKAPSSFEPLKGTRMWRATYDGRKSEQFQNFLSEKLFLVNRQGRIIYSPTMKTRGSYNGYLLSMVLSLGYYGIQSASQQQPFPMSADVIELRARLNNANADLEKKNNLLNKSQREIDLLKEEKGKIEKVEAELTKKNNLVKELQSQLNDIKKNNLLYASQMEIYSVKAALAVKNLLEEQKGQLEKVEAELTEKNNLLKELQSQFDDVVKAAALDEMNKKKKKKNAGLNLKEAKFDPPRTLVQTNSSFLGFLGRMNRTFVNAAGIYLKFDFIGIKAATSISPSSSSEILYYCDQDCWTTSPFKLVQFDENEPQQQIVVQKIYLPRCGKIREHGNPGTWLVNEALRKPGTNSLSCCFAVGHSRFVGQITKTSDTFLNNASVSVFFDQSLHGEYCFVDALATTFFVLETEKLSTWDTKSLNKPPSTC